MSFPHESPSFGNPFVDDALLQSYLLRFLPDSDVGVVTRDLRKFGKRIQLELEPLAQQAEAHLPRLKSGKVVVHRSWKRLHAVAAEEGLIAIGYEKRFGKFARLYQHAKKYLFHPSSAYVSCPLAMTDGAAKLLMTHASEEVQDRILPYLQTRNPKKFWTSGQWMTERNGGSDVSQTETVARFEKGQWRLYGEKFYTSAVTSSIAITLAKVVDSKKSGDPGQRAHQALSLFCIERTGPNSAAKQLRIVRLKDKLGTRALPTAEVRLEGALATLIGAPGTGIRSIATLLNISRTDNAIAALGTSRRMLTLAKDYASKRSAFGKKLKHHPLHLETLADAEAEFQAQFHLVFYLSRILGECESTIGQGPRALLRILTPLAKLYTAKQTLQLTSEMLESFGGAGYMEDTGIPAHFRNAQTLSIWEGTTNILCLDVLRSIHRENTFEFWLQDVQARLDAINQVDLIEMAREINRVLQKFVQESQGYLIESSEQQELGARKFAFTLARLLCASLLLEHAEATLSEHYREVAIRYCNHALGTHLQSLGTPIESCRKILAGDFLV